MSKRWTLHILASAAFVATLVLPGSGDARSLKHALVPEGIDEGVLGDAIRPLSAVIANQVASQIPSFATSAGFTYAYNPELEVYERESHTLGPVFAERALTIGKNRFNIQTSYTYIDFDEINGKKLSKLKNRFEFAAPDGEDEKTFYGLSVFGDDFGERDAQIDLDLDIEAQLFDISLTYGILDNFDINVDLPILRTFARSSVRATATDPRCVGVGDSLCQEDFEEDGGFLLAGDRIGGSRASSIGIGDIRLRAKYNPFRDPVALSGLLDLVVPTGDQDDFQGTGDTRLGTLLIASKEFFGRLETHALGGVEFVVNDVDRSQARYVVGGTAQLVDALALTLDFIGRSEFGAQGRIGNPGRLPAVTDDGEQFEQTREELFPEEDEPAPEFTGRPYFVGIKRNDILDLSLGLKVLVGNQGLLFANFLVPLNQDGIRANFVPTVGFEYNFSVVQ